MSTAKQVKLVQNFFAIPKIIWLFEIQLIVPGPCPLAGSCHGEADFSSAQFVFLIKLDAVLY